MRLSDIKIYSQSYNGDTRRFFDIPGTKYHGYISRDGLTYFVISDDTSSYKDYAAAELDTFLQNLDSNGVIQQTSDIVNNAGDFFSNITTGDTAKFGTGVLLLAGLVIGIILINKK